MVGQIALVAGTLSVLVLMFALLARQPKKKRGVVPPAHPRRKLSEIEVDSDWSWPR